MGAIGGSLAEYPRWPAVLSIYMFAARMGFKAHHEHREQTRLHKLVEWGGCRSRRGLARESRNSSGLRVVLASTGQTGTTSVAQALRDMGLKTFHIEEKSTFALPVMWADVDAEVFARTASRCGIEAISLEPSFETLPIALKASPGVKVILTWRDHKSRIRSANKPGWLIHRTDRRYFFSRDARAGFLRDYIVSGLLLLPWLDLWDALTGQVRRFFDEGAMFAGRDQCSALAYLVLTLFSGYTHPRNRIFTRGVFKFRGSEEAYVAHFDEIRRRVPRARLLEFDVKKHGWAELSRFMGLPAPFGLDAPFPHPRRGVESWTNDQLYDNQFGAVFGAVCICFACHILNFVMLNTLVAGICSVAHQWYLRLGNSHSAGSQLCVATCLASAATYFTVVRYLRVLYGWGVPYPYPAALPA